jgi:hypothetical protein
VSSTTGRQARSAAVTPSSGVDAGQPEAVRAGDVDDATAGDVQLERARGLLFDAGPRCGRDRREFAVQVVHRHAC